MCHEKDFNGVVKVIFHTLAIFFFFLFALMCPMCVDKEFFKVWKPLDNPPNKSVFFARNMQQIVELANYCTHFFGNKNFYSVFKTYFNCASKYLYFQS